MYKWSMINIDMGSLKSTAYLVWALCFLVLISSCGGEGDEELLKGTFGLSVEVESGDDQILESPSGMSSDVIIKVVNSEGGAVPSTNVTFRILNPESGAELLSDDKVSFTAVTDSQGRAKVKVVGANDFGKTAIIRARISGTNSYRDFNIHIRDVIVPTRVQVVDPPSPVVANAPFNLMFRLVDDTGRIAEDPRFDTEITVNFGSASGDLNNTDLFNKTSPLDRRVVISEGVGTLSGIQYKRAEEVVISISDHGKIGELEDEVGHPINISNTKTMLIVPDAPVRMQLDQPNDATTDDIVEIEANLYDQFDNFAYNFNSPCSARFQTVGLGDDGVWIVDPNDINSFEKERTVNFLGGRATFNIRDSEVETVNISITGSYNNCAGFTNLGPTVSMFFDVGSASKIVFREPPETTAKTTEELELTLESTDSFGNFNDLFSGTVEVVFDSECEAFINPADHSGNQVTLSSGTRTIRVQNTNLNRASSVSCTLSLNETLLSEGFDLTSTQVLNFIPGDPRQLAFAQSHYEGKVGFGTAPSQRNPTVIDIEVLDFYANPVFSFPPGNTVEVYSDGTTEISTTDGDPATGPKEVNIGTNARGSVEVWGLKNETVTLRFREGPEDIRYTLMNAEGVSVNNATNIEATLYYEWGIPSYFEVKQPDNGTVDDPITVEVGAYDYGGNRVFDYGSAPSPETDLELLVSGNAVVNTGLEFVQGIASTSISNTVEEIVTVSLGLVDGVTSLQNEESQNIDFTDSENAFKDVYFRWGDINRKFVLTGPTQQSVDSPAELMVQVFDQYDNRVRDYGCGGSSQNLRLTANNGAKLTTLSSFDHTDLTDFNNLGNSTFVNIAIQDGACPIDSLSDDASYGYAYLFHRTISPVGAANRTVNVQLEDTANTGYSLLPSGGYLVDFLPGSLSRYVMQDQEGTVDDPIQISVQAMDQFNNHVISYVADSSVQFRWVDQGNANIVFNGPDNRSPGDLFIDFLSGNNGAGYIYLENEVSETVQAGLETKTGYDTSAVANILFDPGQVTEMVLIPPSDLSTITTDDKVLFHIHTVDQYGNHNIDFDGQIRVTVNNNAGIVTNPNETNPDAYNVTQSRLININDGVGELYVYDPVVETVTIQMIDEDGLGLTLAPLEVDFLHGVPVLAAISEFGGLTIDEDNLSVSTTADNPEALFVEIRDRNGNRADSFQQNVNLRIRSTSTTPAQLVGSSPDAEAIPDTSTHQNRPVSIVNGTGSLYLLARSASGSVHLDLADPLLTGLDLAPSSSSSPVVVNINHGSPYRFGIDLNGDTLPTPGTRESLPSATRTGDTDNNFPVNIRAYDYYNNIASTFNGDIAFSVNKNAEVDPMSLPVSSSPISSKSAQVGMIGGSASLEIFDRVVETNVTLSLSNDEGTNTAMLDNSHTRSVNFSFGSPDYFAIIKPGSDNSVENPSTVNIEIRDQHHNVITSGFEGSVDFTVNNDGFLNDASDINPTTGFLDAAPIKTRTVNFPSGNNGVRSITVYDRTAETVTYSLSNGVATQPVSETLDVIDKQKPTELKTQVFYPGPAEKFDIQEPSTIDALGNHVTADEALLMTVRAYDRFDNFANNFSESEVVEVAMTNGGMVVEDDEVTEMPNHRLNFGAPFPQGTSRFLLRNTLVGVTTVSLVDYQDNDYITNEVDVNVKHGEAYKLHITGHRGLDVTGDNPIGATRTDNPVQVDVTSFDQFENVVLDYDGQAIMSVVSGGDGHEWDNSNPIISSWNDGVGQKEFTKTVVGNITVRVDGHGDSSEMDTSESESSRIINIVHGTPSQFAFIPSTPPYLAGEEVNVTLEAQDVHGNRATSYGGTNKNVRVEYRSGEGKFKSGSDFVDGPLTYDFSSGTATAILRKRTFNSISYPQTTESITLGFLEADDASMNVDATQSLTFQPNEPRVLKVVVDPILNPAGMGPFPIDDPVEVRIEARDEYENYTNQFTGNVNFTVDKDAWVYQEGVDFSDQNHSVKSVNTQLNNGFRNIRVANLTAETNVALGLNTPTGGNITTLEGALIDFMHGEGVEYLISFPAKPGEHMPQFSTDAPVVGNITVVDQGGNRVLAHSTHNVGLISTPASSNTFEDVLNCSGSPCVSVQNGFAEFEYQGRSVGNYTLNLSASLSDSGLTRNPKGLTIIPGTVSQLVINAPSSMTADHILVSDNTFEQPACSGAPGSVVCPRPFATFNVEPQDQYGNLNDIEPPSKVYEVSLTARPAGGGNSIWNESIKISEGKAFMNDGSTIFNKELIQAQNVRFTLASPNPSSQVDETGNTVSIDVSSEAVTEVGPGSPAKIWIVQPSNNTIDNPINVTVQVQDGHDVSNGNGNLVTNAPPFDIDFTLSSIHPSFTGLGPTHPSDTDPNDSVNGNTITIRGGVGVYQLESLMAESVDIGLAEASSGTNGFADGHNGVYFDIPGQTKTVTFSPGLPQEYAISPRPANASLYDDSEADNLRRFEFPVRVFDQGGNFRDGVNGSVLVDATIADGDVILCNFDESECATDTLKADVVDGEALLNFKTEKSGTVNLTLREDPDDPLNLSANDTNHQIIVSPGPVTQLAFVDPSTVRTTSQTDVSLASDSSYQNTTPVVLRALDAFDNFNNNFTGPSIRVLNDSSTLETLNPSNGNVQQEFSFDSGQAVFNTRNTRAETTELTLFDYTNQFTEIDITSAPAVTQVTFTAGPVAQLSLEVDENSESHTLTSLTTDAAEEFTIRTRDIYGNLNTVSSESTLDNEVNLSLTFFSGGDGYIGTMGNTSHTLDLVDGLGTFDVLLQQFGSDRYETSIGRELGLMKGLDKVRVDIDSSSSGLAFFQGIASRTIYFQHGEARNITMDNPDPLLDKTTDDTVPVTMRIRDDYGNLATSYGDGSTFSVVLETTGNATINEVGGEVFFGASPATDGGTAIAHVENEVAEEVTLTMSNGTGVSVDSLPPLLSGVYSQTQQLLFRPGAPTHLLFTDSRKSFGDIISTSNVGPITEDSDSNLITVDDPVVIYAYTVDSGGNINNEYNQEDFFTVSATQSASIDTSHSLYGDIVNGEGQVTLEHTVDEIVRLTVNSVSGGLDTNYIDVEFDHGVLTNFAWSIPTGRTVDQVAPITIMARDQYGNSNTKYSGEVVLSGGPAGAASGVTAEPYISDSSANDSPYSDPALEHFQQTGGVVRSFASGSLSLDVKALRSTTFNINIDSAEVTADSSNNITLSSDQITFSTGAPYSFEIYDPLDVNYDIYTSDTSIHFDLDSNSNPLTTDDYAIIGVQAVDRGGNRAITYNESNVVTINSTPDDDIDFVLEGNTSWSPQSKNLTLSFSNGLSEVEMRSEDARSYDLSLSGMPGGISERAAGEKEITFLPGQFRQVTFPVANVSEVRADDDFTLHIEARDSFGNLSEYEGLVRVGLNVDGDVVFPGDAEFPDYVVFPPGQGTPSGASAGATSLGTIYIEEGEGSLSGFEGHLAGETLELVIVENDFDFDQSGNIGATSFSHSVLVRHGDPTYLAYDGSITDTVVDNDAVVTLKITDIHGNICTDNSGDVLLTIDGTTYDFDHKKISAAPTAGSSGADTSSSGNILTINNGVSDFNIWSQRSEDVNLTLATNGSIGGHSVSVNDPTRSFEFLPDAAVEIKFAESNFIDLKTEGDEIVGNQHRLNLVARDQFQNIANLNANVTIVSSEPSLLNISPAGVVGLTAGTGFLDVESTIAHEAELTLSNAPPGLDITHEYELTYIHDDPTGFTIIADDNEYTIDEHALFVVQAIDQFGNSALTFEGNVEIRSSNFNVYRPTNTSQDPGVGENESDDAAPGLKFSSGQTYSIGEFDDGRVEIHANSIYAESVTLRIHAVSDENFSVAVEQTETITFTHGQAKYYRLVQPTPSGGFHGTVDDPIVVTVEARDRGLQQVDTNYGLSNAAEVLASNGSLGTFDVYKQTETPSGDPGDGTDRSQFDFTFGTAEVQVRSRLTQQLNLEIDESTLPTGIELDGAPIALNYRHGAIYRIAFIDTPITETTTDDNFEFVFEAQDQYFNRNDSFDGTVRLVADRGTMTHDGSIITGGQEVTIPSGGMLDFSLEGDGTATRNNLRVTSSGKLNGGTQMVRFGFQLFDGAPANDVPNLNEKHTVTIRPGEPDIYRLLPAPVTNVVVGDTQTLTVRAEDANGNLVDDKPAGTFDLNLGAASDVQINGSISYHGTPVTMTMPANSGIAEIDLDSTLAQSISVQIEEASVDSVPVTGTTSFNFIPGPCVEIRFANTSQESTTVDNPFSLDFEALDEYGNIAVSCTETFTLAATKNSTGGEIDFTMGNGVGDVTFVSNGLVSKNVQNKVSNTIINFSIQNPTGAITSNSTTKEVIFNHGVSDHFYFALEPKAGGVNYNIDDIIPFEIEARDQFDNIVENYNESITISSSQTDPFVSGTTNYFSNNALVIMDDGVVSGGYLEVETLKAETFTLTISAAPNMPNIGQTASATIIPGEINHLRIVPLGYGSPALPGNTDVKTPIDVEALDRGLNHITDYTTGSSIANLRVLSVSGSNIANTDLTTTSDFVVSNTPYLQSIPVQNFDGGVATFYVKSEEVGQFDVTLDDFSGSLTQEGGDRRLEFEPGAAAQIVFISAPTTQRADLEFSVELEAQDQFGNHTPDFSGTILLTQVTGGGMGCINLDMTGAFVDGRHTYEGVTCRTAESIELGVAYGSGPNVNDLSATHPMTITHGETDLRFFMFPMADVTVSDVDGADLRIELRDAYGNFANSMVNDSGDGYDVTLNIAGDVSSGLIYADDTSMSSESYLVNIPDGVGYANVDLRSIRAQDVSLSMSDAGMGFPLQPSSGRSFKFVPGDTDRLRFVSTSATIPTTEVYELEIEAYDEFDNVANFSGSVTISADDMTDLQTGSTGSITMSSGEGSISIQRTSPTSSPVNFSLSGPAGINTDTNFALTVVPGAPSQINFAAAPTGVTVETSGEDIFFTLQDVYGNPTVPSAGNTLNATLSVISGSAIWGDTTTGTTSVSWSNASDATQSKTITNETAQQTQISFTWTSESGIDISDVLFLNFAHGAADAIRFADIPENRRTDQITSIFVELVDQYGNITTTINNQGVTLSLTSIDGITGDFSGGGTQTVSAGVTEYMITSATRQTLRLDISNGDGLTNPSSENLEIAWGVPYQITWKELPTPVQAGNTWGIEAQVEDSRSNILLEYSGTLNLDFTWSGEMLFDGTTAPGPGFAIGYFADATVSNGVAEWALTGEGAGGMGLTASKVSGAGSPSNATGSMAVLPDDPTRIRIMPPTNDGIVSLPTSVTTYLEDAFGNLSAYSGSINFEVRDSQTQTPTDDDGYHEVAGEPSIRSISYSNSDSQNFDIRKPTMGWANVHVPSPPAGMETVPANGMDFYFMPGEPVEYRIVLPETPSHSLFHSTVSDPDQFHAATGVPQTVTLEAVDLAGSKSVNWGGCVQVHLTGNARILGSSQVCLTSGDRTFEIVNEFDEDVTITLEDLSGDDVHDGTTTGACEVLDECAATMSFGRSRADRLVISTEPVYDGLNFTLPTHPSGLDVIRGFIRSGGSTEDEVLVHLKAYDESDELFESYFGYYTVSGCHYNPGGSNFNLSDGEGQVRCADRYKRTLNLNAVRDPDYSGPPPIAIENGQYRVHNNVLTRIRPHCTGDNITPTDEVQHCFVRPTDSHGDGSTVGLHQNAVSEVDGLSIDFRLLDSSSEPIPHSSFYLDVNNTGTFDPEDELTQSAEGETVDFTGTMGLWDYRNAIHQHFYVGNEQSEFVYVTMDNLQYTGSDWTAAQINNINYGYQQAIFFTPAETATIKLEITGSPENPAATLDHSEYYTATISALTSNESVATTENGYVYVNINSSGTSSPADLSGVYMDSAQNGSYTQTNQVLVQFVNGVAEVDVASQVAGEINIELSHPGSSTIPFDDNNQVKNFIARPATQLVIQEPGETRYADLNTQEIEVRALDENNNIDPSFSELVNVTFTLSSEDKRDKIQNLIGDQIQFTNGVATLDVQTDEFGTYSLGVSYGSLTPDTQSISFVLAPPSSINRSDSNSIELGALDMEFRAENENGVLASNFSGLYNITYRRNGTIIKDGSTDDGTITGPVQITISNGLGTLSIASSRDQVIEIEFTELFTNGPSPDFPSLTGLNFTHGVPSQMAITSQPEGAFPINDTLDDLVVEIQDDVGNAVTDYSENLTVSAHVGSGCSSVDNSNFTNPGAQTPVNGVVTFSGMSISVAQETSLEIIDSGATLSSICSDEFDIYGPLAATLLGSEDVLVGETRIVELSGGHGSISISNFSTSTDSTAVMINSSDPECSVDNCVRYTAGSESSTDIITVSDSADPAQTDSVTLNLQTPDFAFLDADDGDSAMSNPFFMGEFVNMGDGAQTIKIRNDGPVSSGELTVTYTPDEASMWSVDNDFCDGATLAEDGGECTIYIIFLSGSEGANPGQYSKNIEVKGLNDAGQTSLDLEAELLTPLELLDDVNAPLGESFDMGAFDGSDDEVVTVRVRHDAGSSVGSGAITTSLDTSDPGMWTIVFNGCDSPTDLTPGGTCDIDLRFNASSGGGSAGAYSVDLIVEGVNTGESKIEVEAELLTSLEFLDESDSPLGAQTNMGAFDDSTDEVITLRVRHDAGSTVDSGAITTSLDTSDPGMWTIVFNGCDSPTDLTPGGTCDIDLRFNASSGGGSAGAYSVDLIVEGVNTGESKIEVEAELLTSLEFLDESDSPLGAQTNMGAFDDSTDEVITLRVRHDAGSTVDSGEITTSLDSSDPGMWTIVFNGCDSPTDLTPGGTCDIDLRFNASSGGGSDGIYNVEVSVIGENAGEALVDVEAELDTSP